MFVGVDVRGEKQIQAAIDALPDEVKDSVTESVMQYLLNIERAYPPYKHITRAQAWPSKVIAFPSGKRLVGWHSIKQFRYVMARISEGSITPGKANRTQTFSRNWRIEDKGRNAFLVNETPYGPYLKDDQRQSPMQHMIGWTTIGADLQARRDKILERVAVGAKQAMKKRNRNK